MSYKNKQKEVAYNGFNTHFATGRINFREETHTK